MHPQARSILVVVISLVATPFLKVTDTSLLEGLGIQALSILSAVAITAAFFFLQNVEEMADRTIERLEELRRRHRLVPLSDEGIKDIRTRFQNAATATHKNGVAVLVLVAIFVSLTVAAYIDVPWIAWPQVSPATKLQVIHGFAFASFFLMLFATSDILSTTYAAHLLRTKQHERPDGPSNGKAGGPAPDSDACHGSPERGVGGP